jgi:hypothetical protein
LLAAAGVLAVAAIFFTGAVQLAPVPAAELNQLAAEMADPGSVQHCTADSQVRYCLYPGFGRDLSSIETPVREVLALLPARPSRPLTVRQVLSLDFTDPTLTRGQPQQQVSRWTAQTRNAPGIVPVASAIYLTVGEWAAAGSLTDADFNVALATAGWAVGLTSASQNTPLPGDQAREAIAIWLAILATRPPAGELQAGLSSGGHYLGDEVSNTFVPTWTYPGMTAGYLASSGIAPQPTAAGYLLAAAMVSLPQQKVRSVLASAWGRWLNWHTTDAQLAAALGIPMPSISTLVPPLPPGQTTGHGPANGPQSPLCTS